MKRMALFVLVWMGSAGTGCMPSLYPLYTEQDLVFDVALIGLWEETEDGMLWIFEKSDLNTYRLSIIDDAEKSDFEARLLQLGNRTYLDLCPEDLRVESGFYASHFVKAHTFYRVELSPNRLEISGIRGDWLRQRMESGELSIEILEPEPNVLLAVSPTPLLQEFILQFGDQLWDDAGVLVRTQAVALQSTASTSPESPGR